MATWGRVDLRQLKDFQAKINQLAKADADKFTEQMVWELAERLLRKVVKRTPTDTGDLKRGWQIGTISRKGQVFEVEVYNPLEYAAYVEYGHRTSSHNGWVPGRFMLTISVKELEQVAPRIVEKRLVEFLAKELEIK